MDLAALRDSIALTREQIYMNTGWSGPSPMPVVERIHEALTLEATSGPASLEGLALGRRANEEAQAAVAKLLNAESQEIYLTHGTTEGVHIVLHGFPWSAGDELVTCDLEHPAIATPVNVLEERRGIAVKRVGIAPNASSGEMLEAIASALTPKTKIVALSHIQYTCGLRMPIESITRMAHQAGALVLVDGAQTGGAINIDVKAMDVDFYAISGQKWLLGPQATGAVFLRESNWRAIDPLFTTHALADARAQMAEGFYGSPLQRFRVTSQSPSLLAGFAAAINIIDSVGPATIEAHSLRLAKRLKDAVGGLKRAELTCPEDEDVSCGLVSIAIEGKTPTEVVQHLWENHRIAARAVNHPPAVRFSLAGFNTEAEVDKVAEALTGLV